MINFYNQQRPIDFSSSPITELNVKKLWHLFYFEELTHTLIRSIFDRIFGYTEEDYHRYSNSMDTLLNECLA